VFNLQYIHINPSQSKWNNYVAENKITYLFSLDYFLFLPDDDIITLGSHSRSSAFFNKPKIFGGKNMCTIREACNRVGMSYDTLKFYCKEGLVPNVKRDKNNYRDFDEKNIKWLEGLLCLRHCGMSINDMKEYMNLCIKGFSTIMERKEILDVHRAKLVENIKEIQKSIDYIDYKRQYYDDVASGRTQYSSNLIDNDK